MQSLERKGCFEATAQHSAQAEWAGMEGAEWRGGIEGAEEPWQGLHSWQLSLRS